MDVPHQIEPLRATEVWHVLQASRVADAFAVDRVCVLELFELAAQSGGGHSVACVRERELVLRYPEFEELLCRVSLAS